TFAKPDRQFAEIQKQECMRIFVIDSVKRRRSFAVEAKHHVILLSITVEQARRADVRIAAPLLRREHLHRRLVASRQNYNRLRRIDSELGKSTPEDPPHPLKLQRNPPRLALPGVALNHEVGAPYLKPARVLRTLSSRQTHPQASATRQSHACHKG